MYIPGMYVDEQCTHIVHTCYIHVYTSTLTWYRHVYTCIYLLKKKLPDKTGEKTKWNFEKAHSILHKVRDNVLWGNSDNTSCQAPEVSTVQMCMYTSVHCSYMFILCIYTFVPRTLPGVLFFNLFKCFSSMLICSF
jgi:hypothetical protein